MYCDTDKVTALDHFRGRSRDQGQARLSVSAENQRAAHTEHRPLQRRERDRGERGTEENRAGKKEERGRMEMRNSSRERRAEGLEKKRRERRIIPGLVLESDLKEGSALM